MSGDDLTVSILREIRDEVRGTNSRLDATNERIDATNVRLEAGFDAIDERIGETNARLEVVETTLKDFAGQHLLLTRYIKNTVDRHDDAIDDLRDRVERLETKPAP